VRAVLVIALGLSLTQLVPALISPASAASSLNVFAGYFDTHTVPFSSNQPNPWPYKDPSSYVGTPCPNYPNDTTCWDTSALRLDNPGSADVTGVQVVVVVGTKTYNRWGSNLTVKAGGMLVLTETGSSQNSTNFDLSDFAPNSYNGGNTASCVDSGAIPTVKITIAGVTTTYLDNGQVLNGGGVDSGHCLNGKFVSGRMDESHPWVQIGASSPVAPSAPQSLAAKAGDGSVSLTWTPPASNGGAAVSGYNIYRSTSPGGEGSTPVKTGVTTTSFTDTSLTNGTTYYYTVAAVNAAGTSPQSNEASATPRATVPSAPTGLVASAGDGKVMLSWTVPNSDGGSPITGYNVYRSTTPGGEGGTVFATAVSSTYTDQAVTNGTTYYYTVAAVNAVGTSPQSGEANATPQATAPTAPLGLTASAGNNLVSLSWSVPASTGGSPITSYNVYRSTSPGGEGSTALATGVTTASYTDNAVTNGTTYYYKVAAVNSAGTSPQSNEASATPKVPSAAAYIGRVGSATASSSQTTISVPVGAPGVAAGHTLVVSLLLSSTRQLTTAVSATDSAGNSYVVGRDTNDGSSGDRTVVLVSVGVKALAAGGSITLTYPSSGETHVSIDEFSGITGIDTSAGATGTTAAFSSGTAPATTQATDVLIGVVGIESGKSPTSTPSIRWPPSRAAMPPAARPAESGWPASSPSRPADAGSPGASQARTRSR
jgi:titin